MAICSLTFLRLTLNISIEQEMNQGGYSNENSKDGRYVIDAKSIMGIFSLDLSKPIDLNIHADDNVEEIMEMLKPYLCD